MRLRNALATLGAIRAHPLTRDRPLRSFARYLRWQLGSRLVPGKVAMSWVNSSKLLVGGGMWGATSNVYCGLQDFEEMGFLLHLLRPDDLFVDVGANVGAYTVLGSAAAAARTIAIEPLPEAFGHLLDNVRVNGIEHRVTALNSGAADRPGRLEFSGADTLNHVVTGPGERGAASFTAEVVTLDGLLETADPVLLKIDAEGYETAILDGAQRTLARESLVALLLELDGHGEQYGFDEVELHRRLERLGFVSCAYSPATRELTVDVTDPSRANRVYVRSDRLEQVRTRLRDAPPFTVCGRDF